MEVEDNVKNMLMCFQYRVVLPWTLKSMFCIDLYIKEYTPHSSQCYWTEKQIGRFCIHPSI